MSTYFTGPYVEKISFRCSLVTFLVRRPTNTRTGFGASTTGFSSFAEFLLGLWDFDLDLRLPSFSSLLFFDLEVFESLLDERLDDRELPDEEPDPDREPESLELPELELELPLLDFGIFLIA